MAKSANHVFRRHESGTLVSRTLNLSLMHIAGTVWRWKLYTWLKSSQGHLITSCNTYVLCCVHGALCCWLYDAAYMIHCSAAFMTAANSSGNFVFEERGTINVKVWWICLLRIPCYNNMTYMQYEKNTKYTNINTNESRHSEMDPVWQNPIQRTVRTAHLRMLITVHSFSRQYNTEQYW